MYSDKSIFESRTFWANAITTALGILTLLMGEAWIKEIPGSEGTLLAIIGLLNIALRFVTVDAVKLFAVVFAMSFALASEAHAAVQIVSVAEPKPVVAAPSPRITRTQEEYDAFIRPLVEQAKADEARTACYVDANGVRRCPGTVSAKGAPVARGGFLRRLFNR